MEFAIKEYKNYNKEEILNLYKSVGWINYTDNPKMLEDAYANSLRTLGAYENEKLIGIIRVVGDGYSVVFIQDILVYPEYQRKGIGTVLLNRYTESLKARKDMNMSNRCISILCFSFERNEQRNEQRNTIS